jgi:hypothetical protein
MPQNVRYAPVACAWPWAAHRERETMPPLCTYASRTAPAKSRTCTCEWRMPTKRIGARGNGVGSGPMKDVACTTVSILCQSE